MPGRETVNPDKLKQVDELAYKIEKYPVVGILNMYKLPTKALQHIRKELKDKAEIKITQKNILLRSLERNTAKRSLEKYIGMQSAILLTEMNPFKLHKFLEKNKTPAPAKAGDIAPKDIEVKAGPTDLMPGPAISTLSKVKIPAKVEAGKIAISKDVIVAKKDAIISADLATVLQMLKIEPMEVGLDLVAVFENNMIYTKDVLSIDETKLMADISLASVQAFNLAFNSGYPTKETIEMMIIKAVLNAKALDVAKGSVN